MSETLVRPFRSVDGPEVTALWEDAFADDRPWNAPDEIVRRKVAQRDGLFWVAEVGGRIAGAVMAGYDGQRGWIYHLAVDPDRRRGGIGSALMHAAEVALASRGCPKVNLQILPSNAGVVAFYERVGWCLEDRVSMGKKLAPVRSASAPDDTPRISCSFCGKTQDEVRKLIAGPTSYICDECIDLCNDIIAEDCEGEKPGDGEAAAGSLAATVACVVCRLPTPAEAVVLLGDDAPVCAVCVEKIGQAKK